MEFSFKRLFVWLGVLFLISTLGCRSIANRLLLFPSRDPVYQAWKRRVIESESGELELFEAEFGAMGPVEFSILSLTGNGGRAERTLPYTAELIGHAFGSDPIPRYRVLALNYPGYGQSEGDASLEKLGPAALAAYHELRSRPDCGPVLIHGLSMGSTAALHVARVFDDSEERPAGLLLEKGPDLWGLIVWKNGWWNLWLVALPVAWGLPESVRSDLNAAAISNTAALFIVGQRDTVVPAAYAHSIAESYQGPSKRIEAQAGHNEAVTPRNAPQLTDQLHWLLKQAGIRQ